MPFEMKENRAEYWQERALLGEVSFPALRPGVVNIDHVFVDPVLRGKGVAGQLLEQVCAALRRTGVPFFSPRYSRTAAGTVAAYSFSSCSLSRMSSCSFLFAR